MSTKSKKRPAQLTTPEATPKARKKRGVFDPSDRRETGITRSWGACLRCHNQRVRCNPNPDDPSDPEKPCRTCIEVDMDTKKAIHRIPCLRLRLQTIVTHRSGGLNITKRFAHNQVVDLYDYKDNEVFVINMTQGLCKVSFPIKVRRFNPKEGDNLARVCINDKGTVVEWPLAAVCLSDIHATANEFQRYLQENALDSLTYSFEKSDQFIKKTYAVISEHYKTSTMPDDEKRVLWDAIVLFFALRHLLGSSWISGGNFDSLYRIQPEYPVIKGKYSTPRMIIAQFDSIQHEIILKSQAPKVLKALHRLYYNNKHEPWLTIYSITFMLLHHASLASADRRRWASQRNITETRYGLADSPLTKHIEEVQEGTKYLLAHWHYYKHNIDLLNFDWKCKVDSPMKHLTENQIEWMEESCDLLRETMKGLENAQLSEDRWDDECYFVSKMYNETWMPEATFSRSIA